MQTTYKVRKKPTENPITKVTAFHPDIFFSKLSGETEIHHSCFRNCQAPNYVSLFQVLLLGYFLDHT